METGGRAVLVDSGLPGRELLRRMALAGLDAARLDAVLVTHEHRDHVLGVGVIARKLRLPVYINAATLDRSQTLIGRIDPRFFRTGEDLTIGSLHVHAFSLSHDAGDPVGFTFEENGAKLGLATDLGVVTGLVRECLARSTALIVEANHDPQMLMDGPYPWETKRRVKGRRGHLSNQEAAELLAAVNHRGLNRVVLAHLSQTNNLPELALECAREALAGLPLDAASQDRPGPVIEI